jgi:hypothetical protein
MRDGGPGNYYVRCDNCAASSDDRLKDTAVELWNRRADSARIEALERALREVISVSDRDTDIYKRARALLGDAKEASNGE